MSWIKRNVYFLAGSLVAVGLMVFGVFYLMAQYAAEQQITEEIRGLYAELDRLNGLNPHPGAGAVDNVKVARQQETDLKKFAADAALHFAVPPAIPDTPKVEKQQFAKDLAQTIAELVSEAQQANVSLPKEYYFTFQAQKGRMTFETGTLEKLAARLGEVKALCEILFTAKINALDNLKREVVSSDDQEQSDFLKQRTVATTLAEITPYEVTFRCFSGELAGVLNGFTASPYNFVVKAVNVEPAPPNTEAPPPPAPAVYIPPPPPAASPRGGGLSDAEARMVARYTGGRPQPAATAPVASPPPVVIAGRGPVLVLNEQPLRVVVAIELVKRRPAK